MAGGLLLDALRQRPGIGSGSVFVHLPQQQQQVVLQLHVRLQVRVADRVGRRGAKLRRGPRQRIVLPLPIHGVVVPHVVVPRVASTVRIGRGEVGARPPLRLFRSQFRELALLRRKVVLLVYLSLVVSVQVHLKFHKCTFGGVVITQF